MPITVMILIIAIIVHAGCLFVTDTINTNCYGTIFTEVPGSVNSSQISSEELLKFTSIILHIDWCRLNTVLITSIITIPYNGDPYNY